MAGVYSVAQVNSYIKNMFAQDFLLRRLSVKGEVSNCKYHSSGHIYFTLKDGGGTLQAVMFASQRRGLNFKLAEGQQVVVKGTVDVYERDGKYQLYASEIELSGRGDLYLRFEKLLKELEEMGMFDPQYKRPISRFAKTVGIVTAPTGAAARYKQAPQGACFSLSGFAGLSGARPAGITPHGIRRQSPRQKSIPSD